MRPKETIRKMLRNKRIKLNQLADQMNYSYIAVKKNLGKSGTITANFYERFKAWERVKGIGAKDYE